MRRIQHFRIVALVAMQTVEHLRWPPGLATPHPTPRVPEYSVCALLRPCECEAYNVCALLRPFARPSSSSSKATSTAQSVAWRLKHIEANQSKSKQIKAEPSKSQEIEANQRKSKYIKAKPSKSEQIKTYQSKAKPEFTRLCKLPAENSEKHLIY